MKIPLIPLCAFISDCQLDSKECFVQNDRRLTVTWTVYGTIQNECLNENVNITLMSDDCQNFADCGIETEPIPVQNFNYTFDEPLKFCKSYIYVVQSVWNSKEKRVNPIYPKIEDIELTGGDDYNSMNVSWKYPEEENCPNALKVEASGKIGSNFENEPSSLLVSYGNELKPCENYGYELNKTTPLLVTNLTATYYEDSWTVDLRWLHSDTDAACIRGYNVYVENQYDNRTIFKESKNAYIISMVACTTYRFRVVILTVYGLETDGAEISVDIPSRGEFIEQKLNYLRTKCQLPKRQLTEMST